MGAIKWTVIDELEEALAWPRRRLMGCELVQRFLGGTLTEQHYILFLWETWHFVRHTPRHLLMAAERMPAGPMRARFETTLRKRPDTTSGRWTISLPSVSARLRFRRAPPCLRPSSSSRTSATRHLPWTPLRCLGWSTEWRASPRTRAAQPWTD